MIHRVLKQLRQAMAKSERGQALAEYMPLIPPALLLSVMVLVPLSSSMDDIYCTAANALQRGSCQVVEPADGHGGGAAAPAAARTEPEQDCESVGDHEGQEGHDGEHHGEHDGEHHDEHDAEHHDGEHDDSEHHDAEDHDGEHHDEHDGERETAQGCDSERDAEEDDGHEQDDDQCVTLQESQGGSQCEQSGNCYMLPGLNSGTFWGSTTIEGFVIKAGTEYRSYSPGHESDGCYEVTIAANMVHWEKVGSGPSCKDVSHGQAWKVPLCE